MNNRRAIVIVGAGEAGTAAAVALREGGWPAAIVLIGNEAMLPYERPPLSKAILVGETDPTPRVLIGSERLAELGIEYCQGRSAVSINRKAHIVVLSDGEQLTYERLLLTTGAGPRKLNIPGSTGSGIAMLRTYADAVTIRRIIKPGCELVVVGGGFIGLEVAASAVSRGASVTVIEAGPRLLTRSVPAPMAELIKSKHERSGVRIETDAIVERINTNGRRSSVVLANGRTRLADLVLIAVGAVPNVELAQEAGLTIDNGIAADEMLATSDPDIFAAGDCCSFPHRLYNERVRLEAWRNAQRQGRAVAANMLGANRPYEDVPWFWSDQYDETLQIAGLCREDGVSIARNLGAKGQLIFFLGAEGRLMAACGFGNLGVIAREVRFAEMMISKRLAVGAEALANPSVSMKSLLASDRPLEQGPHR